MHACVNGRERRKGSRGGEVEEGKRKGGRREIEERDGR